MLTTGPEISREMIAARAYQVYLERGRKHGHDWDDWLQAEYELRQLPVRELVKLVDAMPQLERPQTKSLLEVVRLAMIDDRRAPTLRNRKRPVATSLAAPPQMML